MTDVCLISMPYAALERPSLALGLLKAGLKEFGIKSDVLYPNLWFAERIGLHKYTLMSSGVVGSLLGEWTFSGAAFPTFDTNHEEYFQITGYDQVENMEEAWWIREQTDSFIEQVAQIVIDFKPRIVVCSSTFYQHCSSLALLKRVRKKDPAIITVMGGANCEGPMGLATLQAFSWVDYVCSGEGDEIFPKLCYQILKKGRYIAQSDLPYGVMGSYHRKNQLSDTDAPRASVSDINDIPIPDFEEYFQTLQRSSISPYISPSLSVETSRGCWWGQKQHCTFCGLNGDGMTYRSKSPQRVISEFNTLSKYYKIQKFFVVDNILNLHLINTVLPIFARLKNPYSIFYETKVNMKREQMLQLKKAGVHHIQPGIESMHDEALILLKKGNTTLMNVQLLKWGRELGMQILWNFLVGIPRESGAWYKDTLKWLPWIIHLQPPDGVGKVRFDRFSPYFQESLNYELELIPHRAYSYIYPLSREMLNNLAYYFEEVHDLEDNKPSRSMAFSRDWELSAEHMLLKAWIEQWKKSFWSDNPPTLSIKNITEQRIKIIDTRPCRTKVEISLEGLSCQIYNACAKALSPRELVEALHTNYKCEVSWYDIQPIVKKLQADKILLNLRGKMLSLALQQPPKPFIDGKDQAAGYIDISRYIQHTRNPLKKYFFNDIKTNKS